MRIWSLVVNIIRTRARASRLPRSERPLRPSSPSLLPTDMEIFTNFPPPFGRGKGVGAGFPSPPSLLREGEGSEPSAAARDPLHFGRRGRADARLPREVIFFGEGEIRSLMRSRLWRG